MILSKDLVAASATPLILAILGEADSYGYAILQRVKELSRGEMQWTDGMLYPVLHRLDRQGFAESFWQASGSGRKRRYYRITGEGRRELGRQREQWRMVDSTLRQAWGPGAEGRQHPAGGREPEVLLSEKRMPAAAISVFGRMPCLI